MKKSNIKKLMGKNAHWTINKTLAREIGLVETLILQHIIDLQCVWSVTEVFQSYGDMAEELGISEYSIKNSIPKLKKLGLISVQRKSVGFRNFYKVNEDVVMYLMENPSYTLDEPQLTSEVNSTHQLDEATSSVDFNHESVDFDTTSELNPTLSELNSTDQWVENDTTITKNITNNILTKNITKNTTTKSSSGSDKKIIQKSILDILVDANSNIIRYNQAIEDFNELGGIDKISEIMEWDTSIKNNYSKTIQNINLIK